MDWISIAVQTLVTAVTILVSVLVVFLKSHHDRKLATIKLRSEKIEHIVFMLLRLRRAMNRLRDRNFHHELLKLDPANTDHYNQISTYQPKNLLIEDISNIADEIRTIIHFQFLGTDLSQRFEKLICNEFELIHKEAESAQCIPDQAQTMERLENTLMTTVSKAFISELDEIISYVSDKYPLKPRNPSN